MIQGIGSYGWRGEGIMANNLGDGSVLSRPIKPFEGPTRPDLANDGAGPRDQPSSFRAVLADTIQQVNVRQQEADDAVEALATGKTENMAEVMSAVEKADLAFRTLMQFRNKLMTAYQEINNMRI